MLKIILTILLFGCSSALFSKSLNSIEGFAPSYVGEKVAIFEIEDYMSMLTKRIATSEVKADSTFELNFFNDRTRKFRIEIGENHFHVYAQPDGEYKLYVKESSPYLDKNAKGIEVEFFFIDLDSTDINYKILMFEEASLNFLKRNYNHESKSSSRFVEELDTFKLIVQNEYKDDTSTFFKKYVRFAIASLDNLSFSGGRNKYEKYDFYIKPETVWYQNDRYMEYILKYYENYAYEISDQLNESFYQGVIKSSPTIVINKLGADYALDNIRLRELVMIKMLSDVFYTGDYPQTNILTMLDSIGSNGLFEENQKIASNIKYRLLDLVPGAKMPDFRLKVKGEAKSKTDYSGKHLYIQFVKEGFSKSENDIELIRPLYDKYMRYTEILTIVVTEDEELLSDPSKYIQEYKIGWETSFVKPDDQILEKLNVKTYPHYILMDAAGYVVAAPALSPRPDNEYETIEKALHGIKKYRERLEKEK